MKKKKKIKIQGYYFNVSFISRWQGEGCFKKEALVQRDG